MSCFVFVFHLAAQVAGRSVLKKRRVDSDDESGIEWNGVHSVSLVAVVIPLLPHSTSACSLLPES